jgi:dTMP kinase
MVLKRFLIAFEGIDGSGKTTQIVLLKEELDRLLYQTVITKAKKPSQEAVFKKFLKAFDITPDSLSYMFVYQALHRKQFEKTIAALESDNVVLADRWSGSFFVYHLNFGLLSKGPREHIELLNTLAFQDLKPDITFLLDVPPQIAFERRVRRGETNTFDADTVCFYEAVHEKCRAFATENNWIVIDGTLSIEAIHRQIWDMVSEKLGQ